VIDINNNVIIVNFFNSTSKKTPVGKLLTQLLSELADIFSISKEASLDCFVRAGAKNQMVFVNWLKNQHDIVATPFSLAHQDVLHAYGYIVEKNAGLTGALLKLEAVEKS
jgi:hypothetical protein